MAGSDQAYLQELQRDNEGLRETNEALKAYVSALRAALRECVGVLIISPAGAAGTIKRAVDVLSEGEK